ncbi:MAG: hypothetical protein KKB20_01800, partial [Proteobacteria bacterium]|nr:hypothetical protein [Pseudomonadota bacterium]
MFSGKFWIGLLLGAFAAALLIAVSLYAFRGVIAQIDFAGKPEIPVSSAEKATEASKRAMS